MRVIPFLWLKLKEIFFGILDIPYISRELAGLQRPLLVHVSDTPSMTFHYIARLLKRLEPEYLVHTGDIVDEVKLELVPAQIGEYQRKLKRLLHLLRESEATEIYFVPGNHDDAALLQELLRGETMLPEGSRLELDGYRFLLDHQWNSTASEIDFHLYGHAPHTDSAGVEAVSLNGLFNIHIISLNNGAVHKLPYPAGTDNARKMLPPRIGM